MVRTMGQQTNGLTTADAVLSPSLTLAGTVYSVARGFKAGAVNVTVEGPLGMATVPVPADHAARYVVGAPVVVMLHVGG